MSDAQATAAERAYRAQPTGENALALVTAWVRVGGPASSVTLPYEAITTAWLHQGGRDPRRDPRFGDVVESRQTRFASGRRGYTPRRWTVVRPIDPPVALAQRTEERRQQVANDYLACFMPTARPSRRLVRRERKGAENQHIVEVVTFESWRRWAREGTVCRVACETCEGRAAADAGDPTPFPHPPEPCAACYGTGHAFPPHLVGNAHAKPAFAPCE